jgi:DNA (cytosine-5)-methyltransferase 1
MKHGSLFSGVGGFDLAAARMNWENVFHCEWSPFCQRILKYYWPNAITYGDIKKTDFTIHRGTIDVLSGGFPCQPYSLAGKREGTNDLRDGWPEMFRAIREIQPGWVVGENVFGLINWNKGMVFEQIHLDLESEGYEVQSYLLPACGVNAPHKRDRLWIVAHSNSKRRKSGGGNSGFNEESKKVRTGVRFKDDRSSSLRTFADANIWGGIQDNRYGKSRFNNEKSAGPVRWESFPTQSPVCNGNDGLPSGLDGITFSKWRRESIAAGGNAIVPELAFQIFNAINEYTIQSIQ